MYTLTIAVPIYNMEWCLGKNLATYDDPRLEGRVEVLCLNNASEDGSKAVIEGFAAARPQVFRLLDRDSRSYGASINAALAQAQGRYFRIIDADDWVDTEALVQLTEALETGDTDVVLTDYRVADMSSGRETPVRAGDRGVPYGVVFTDCRWPERTLPSIHNTTYRTALLRESGFAMPDQRFFVDEQYVILPYLRAKSLIYYDYDVYRYMVANPAQSTSPKNRAKYLAHREANLRDILGAYDRACREEPENPALPYCRDRLIRGLGDHFTTLYMYVEDRREGRRLAGEWRAFLEKDAPALWPEVRRKAAVLGLLNRLGVSLETYVKLKDRLVKG